LNRNSDGIFANGLNTTGAIVMEVRDSSVARSTGTGIFALTDASRAGIVIDRSTSTLNGGSGISESGANALVHLRNSAVRGNNVGLSAVGGEWVAELAASTRIAQSAAAAPYEGPSRRMSYIL
jgi:hypothetical protein